MPAEMALQLRDVVFRYLENGKRNILDHTDLDVAAGTLTVIMGGSGCGKSTLAAVAAGLYPENGGYLQGGDIRLFGHDLKGLDPQKACGVSDGTVPEPRPAILHGHPAGRNALLPGKYLRTRL